MATKKGQSKSKSSARPMNKKAMKKVKGGAVDMFRPVAVKGTTSFSGGVIPSGGQITV